MNARYGKIGDFYTHIDKFALFWKLFKQIFTDFTDERTYLEHRHVGIGKTRADEFDAYRFYKRQDFLLNVVHGYFAATRKRAHKFSEIGNFNLKRTVRAYAVGFFQPFVVY